MLSTVISFGEPAVVSVAILIAIGAVRLLLMFAIGATVKPFASNGIAPVSFSTTNGVPPTSSETTKSVELMICTTK